MYIEEGALSQEVSSELTFAFALMGFQVNNRHHQPDDPTAVFA